MDNWEDRLPPHVRERLAKIGELTQEEKEKMRYSKEIDSLLSGYFSGDLTPEDLRNRLNELKDGGKEFVLKEAETKLIDTLRLQQPKADFDKRRRAILAIATLKKDKGKYATAEHILSSIESLQREYEQVKEQAYKQLRSSMERQIQAAAQQARSQGLMVDMEGSIEANLKATPQWQDFIARNDEMFEQKFDSYIAKLRQTL